MLLQGILPSIDEELRMPNGSDKSFIEKLHQQNSAVKPYGKVLSNPMNFLVRHYAGEVVYGEIERAKPEATATHLTLSDRLPGTASQRRSSCGSATSRFRDCK